MFDIMRVNVRKEKRNLVFSFEKDIYDIDEIDSLKFSMTDNEIFFDLGDGDWEIPHPDILGLSSILLCNPFIGEELYLPKPVSRNFLNRVSSVISRYKIMSEIDEGLDSLERQGDRPSLAFSGGADSSAALAVMPSDTIPIFLNRPMRMDSRYDSHAPLEICNILSESGYEVQIVTSNLEYLRSPIGFPTDLANAIPAVLLSERLDLDSIAFGTVMESGYGIGHEKFVEYSQGSHWRFYSNLFQSVGLSLSLPVIGVSEVGTAIICNSAPVANLAQSCIRGSFRRPCLRCWKCYRKELLSFSLTQKDPPDFSKMMNSGEIQTRLSAFPISHENVIIYSLQRIDLDEYRILSPIAEKLEMSVDLSCLEKWHYESIEHVPMKYRFSIREKILNYIQPMNREEEQVLKNWNMAPHLKKESTRAAQEKLTSFWQDLN